MKFIKYYRWGSWTPYWWSGSCN